MTTHTDLTDADHKRLFCVARNCASALRAVVDQQQTLRFAAESLQEALAMLKDSGYLSEQQYGELLGWADDDDAH